MNVFGMSRERFAQWLRRGWPKRLCLLAVMVWIGAGLTTCSDRWKEEVLLSDGRVIVVERETLRERGGDEWAFNPSGTKPKAYRLRFEDPDAPGKVIEWKSAKQSRHAWPEHPLILDFDSGQLVVFSDVAGAGGCHIYSKYLFNNGAWVEEALPPKFEARMTNLLIHDYKDRPGFVKLQTKHKRNADVTARDFIRVGPVHPYCR